MEGHHRRRQSGSDPDVHQRTAACRSNCLPWTRRRRVPAGCRRWPSADRFSGCASVAAGLGLTGALFGADGWTGISGNNLASACLCFDESTQQMVQASQISADELYEASLRNVSTPVSCDLTRRHRGDPTQPTRRACWNLEPEPPHGLYRLDGLDQPQAEKSWPADEETNRWQHRAAHRVRANQTYRDSEQHDGAVELRTRTRTSRS